MFHHSEVFFDFRNQYLNTYSQYSIFAAMVTPLVDHACPSPFCADNPLPCPTSVRVRPSCNFEEGGATSLCLSLSLFPPHQTQTFKFKTAACRKSSMRSMPFFAPFLRGKRTPTKSLNPLLRFRALNTSRVGSAFSRFDLHGGTGMGFGMLPSSVIGGPWQDKILGVQSWE